MLYLGISHANDWKNMDCIVQKHKNELKIIQFATHFMQALSREKTSTAWFRWFDDAIFNLTEYDWYFSLLYRLYRVFKAF